jgi:hypothetical protein
VKLTLMMPMLEELKSMPKTFLKSCKRMVTFSLKLVLMVSLDWPTRRWQPTTLVPYLITLLSRRDLTETCSLSIFRGMKDRRVQN